MMDKFIIVIKPSTNKAPILTRCYTRDGDNKGFSVNVFSDEDWAREFSSVEKAMLHYAIRGILAFSAPFDSTSTGYWISYDEMKNFKYETNGIPIN